MARIPNGILGEFIGTAGNVSGYMRMGTNFLRTTRSRSNKPMTPGRLGQQQKIKVCHGFTGPFSGSGFFDKTFPLPSGTATDYNKATSALLKKAITGKYPDTAIAWPLVIISEGGMPSPTDAAASADAGDNVVFTWSNNAGNGTAKDMDKAVLVAWFPLIKKAVYIISDSRRADGMAVLNTQMLQGNTAETWMGFISDDGKDAANSVYTGSLII